MAKKLIWGPILAHLAQIWTPPNVCHGFYHYHTLEIVTKYHCMQFVGKSMIETQ